jgi:hypothetical protein
MITDFLLDSDGDLDIHDGDIAIGEADAQTLARLVESQQGEWRQWPLAGVGIGSFLFDDIGKTEIKHRVAVQAEYDGATIKLIAFSDDIKIKIEGNYGT